MEHFEHEGQRLAYRVFGDGPRTVVLLPGLLLSQRMQWPFAKALARRGNRVITLDPLGHGASDRPADMGRYSMAIFGREAIALLDHLGIERAVLGGTSLGAGITLEAYAYAPDRVQGMIVEMPVLDNALVACAIAFSPLLIGLSLGERIIGPLAGALRRIPRSGVPEATRLWLDWVSQDPAASAAVLQGLFFGRIAPHRDDRRHFTAPALVIGHPRDPVHPFSDADMLVHELPNARLVNANSILERVVRPQRLIREMGDFVEECYSTAGSAASSSSRTRARNAAA